MKDFAGSASILLAVCDSKQNALIENQVDLYQSIFALTREASKMLALPA